MSDNANIELNKLFSGLKIGGLTEDQMIQTLETLRVQLLQRVGYRLADELTEDEYKNVVDFLDKDPETALWLLMTKVKNFDGLIKKEAQVMVEEYNLLSSD